MERRVLSVFLAISFLTNMRLAVFGAFFSLYMKNDLGASLTQLGIILTLVTVVNALSQVVWGYMSDRLAKRKIFIVAGEGIPGAVFFVIPHTRSIVVLAIILITVQVFWSMSAPTFRALIAEYSTPSTRGEVMGKITTFGGIGYVIALSLNINFISNYGYVFLFYFCAFCMLLTSCAAVFARDPDGLKPSYQKLLSIEQVKTLYKEHRTFSIYTLLILAGMFVTQLFEGFISLYAEGLGASVEHISFIHIFRGGTETVLLTPMGKLTDKMGRVKMLQISLIISSAAILFFAMAPVWSWLLPAIMVESVGYSGYSVSSFAVLSSLTPKERRGTYMGFHSLASRFSSVGSSVGGSIGDKHGLKFVFYFSFILSLLAAAYFVKWLQGSREIINQSEN